MMTTEKLIIPHRPIRFTDKESVEAQFLGLPAHAISCNNWAEEYPYTPLAHIRLFHNCKNLFLQFTVEEKDIQAFIDKDFSDVWTDPCVEFFIAVDDKGYYNFECTCIGKLLAAFRKSRNGALPLPQELMDRIIRYPSLGNDVFPLRRGSIRWSLIEIIPVEAMFRHRLATWAGIQARANFYKCGDHLPHPHFLSWSPIDADRPDFHLPHCFGFIEFENCV